MKALADGDGFTEQRYAPATIDELLALSTTFEAPIPAQELRSAVQADLASARHDISIPLNEQVLSYVALFQGRLHDFIDTGMRRGAKYLPMIQNVFRAEGLPLDLAYVPLSTAGAELLFDVVSQRYERGSTIITSDLPLDEWIKVFGTARLTSAMLDRLTHHVHILEMNGESFRLRESKRPQPQRQGNGGGRGKRVE